MFPFSHLSKVVGACLRPPAVELDGIGGMMPGLYRKDPHHKPGRLAAMSLQSVEVFLRL